MSRRLPLITSLIALIVALGVFAASAAAQYPPPAGSCQAILEQRVSDTLSRSSTNRFAVFLNQRVRNVLLVSGSPSGRYDEDGYPIVQIGRTQKTLPVLISAPDDLVYQDTHSMVLEGTDFVHTVRVLRSGVILTAFPLDIFPPGAYYLSLCGVRLVRVEIPEDYDPS